MTPPGNEPPSHPATLALLSNLCGCGEPLEIEMERSAGTCLECQRAEAAKEKAS